MGAEKLIDIDPNVRRVLQREFITAIKDAGLMLVPADAAQPDNDFLIKQKAALSLKAITPYKIAKLKLIPGVTNLKTVKNMVEDGRIGVNEHYTDARGKLYIATSAVKRLRGE